jgi:hypothetical protein
LRRSCCCKERLAGLTLLVRCGLRWKRCAVATARCGLCRTGLAALRGACSCRARTGLHKHCLICLRLCPQTYSTQRRVFSLYPWSPRPLCPRGGRDETGGRSWMTRNPGNRPKSSSGALQTCSTPILSPSGPNLMEVVIRSAYIRTEVNKIGSSSNGMKLASARLLDQLPT